MRPQAVVNIDRFFNQDLQMWVSAKIQFASPNSWHHTFSYITMPWTWANSITRCLALFSLINGLPRDAKKPASAAQADLFLFLKASCSLEYVFSQSGSVFCIQFIRHVIQQQIAKTLILELALKSLVGLSRSLFGFGSLGYRQPHKLGPIQLAVLI
jgi:hypothetical protein